LLVQAVPHVWLDAQILDSKGKPRSGHEGSVFGKLDGGFYFSQLKPDNKGHFHCMVPHGLEDAKIDFMTNEHGALRMRLGKGKPLVHGRQLAVGNIQHDLTGIEVIRYAAPIVLVKMVDASGKLVPTAKVAAIYDKENNSGIMYINAGKGSSVGFEKQPDGRYRTSQMLPDENTRFVASADGYEDAEESRQTQIGREERTEEISHSHRPTALIVRPCRRNTEAGSPHDAAVVHEKLAQVVGPTCGGPPFARPTKSGAADRPHVDARGSAATGIAFRRYRAG
jgi:hypothetical protein